MSIDYTAEPAPAWNAQPRVATVPAY